MTTLKAPVDELWTIQHRADVDFVAAMEPVIDAYIEGRAPDLEPLMDVIGASMALADMYGRRRAWLELDARSKPRAVRAALIDIAGMSDVEIGVVPKVPFADAMADIEAREPRLARRVGSEKLGDVVAAVYRSKHGFALAYSSSREVSAKIQTIIGTAVAKGTDAGKSVSEIVAELSKPGALKREVRERSADWLRAYAKTVYRTNMATAYAAGRFREIQEPAIREVMAGLRFTTAGDVDVRANHRAGEGFVAPVDDPIWDTHSPPSGYTCILPSAFVSGRIQAASKARYSGPVVELETANGNRLAVTVNHPVLTDRGWTAADRVREGDHLVRYCGEGEAFDGHKTPISSVLASGRTIDDQQIPSRIEDVFEAIRAQGAAAVRARLPVLPLDLHGDAMGIDGDVEIVRTAGGFLFDGEESTQLCDEFALVQASPSPTTFDTPSRSDSRLHASCLVGRPSSAALTLDQRPIVRRSSISRPLQPFLLGRASELRAMSDERARNRSAADPVFLGQLEQARTGLVAHDKVARVRRLEWAGHVYDLQTEGGWIVANGIVISNCRCAVEYVDVDEMRRLRLRKADGTYRRMAIPRGWGPDSARFGHRPDRAMYS